MPRLGFGQNSDGKLRRNFVHQTPSVIRGRSVDVTRSIQNHAAIGRGAIASSFEDMKVRLMPFPRHSRRQLEHSSAVAGRIAVAAGCAVKVARWIQRHAIVGLPAALVALEFIKRALPPGAMRGGRQTEDDAT